MSSRGFDFVTPDVSSYFEYVPKGSTHVLSDISEKTKKIQVNALDFLVNFESGDFFTEQINAIRQELVSTAQYFGELQGLEGSALLDPSNLRAEKNGQYSIKFVNTARDNHNRYYAGHIEYGHYTKNRRKFVPARPFMRPALYAVSKASMGELETVLPDLLMTIFRDNGNGYQGIKNLRFGTQLGGRAAQGKPSNFVASGLRQSSENWTTKEYSKFSKRMKGWSIKRGSQSLSQVKRRRDVGFGRKGRNLNNIRQLAKSKTDKDNRRLKEHKIARERREEKKQRETLRTDRKQQMKELNQAFLDGRISERELERKQKQLSFSWRQEEIKAGRNKKISLRKETSEMTDKQFYDKSRLRDIMVMSQKGEPYHTLVSPEELKKEFIWLDDVQVYVRKEYKGAFNYGSK